MSNTNQKITTFLMFEGKAEEAMNFYTSQSVISDPFRSSKSPAAKHVNPK